SNVRGAQDDNDRLDGGSEFDVIAGDNATVWRRFDALSPRFITLNASTIYNTFGDINSSDIGANPVLRADPTGNLHRTTPLFGLSNNPLPGTHGDDYLAGGANNDEIYGELGNDVIQGDGSIALSTASVAGSITNLVGASSDPTTGALTVLPAAENTTDGNDYIEGGGGSDVNFGRLGRGDP